MLRYVVVLGSFVLLLSTAAREAGAALYYPHAVTRAGWSTEICVANTSAADSVRGTFRAFSDAGLMLAESAPVTLAANARIKRGLEEIFPGISNIGYVVFETPALTVSGFARMGTSERCLASIPAAAKPNADDFYITHIASLSDWWTGISLVNTTPYPKQLTVEFNNGATKTVELPAHGRYYAQVQEWFGGQPQPALQSAIVKNGAGIVGSELFGSTNQTGPSLLDGLLLEDQTASRLFFPHLAQDDFWWTGIVVFNPATVDCRLRITPHRSDGTSLPEVTQTLKPRQRYIGLLSTLGLPQEAAWLEVEGSVPVTGFELFATQNGEMMAGYTGVNISSKEGIFPSVERLSYTGIALVNVSSAKANVILTAFDDQGKTVISRTTQVAPYAKQLGFTFEFFPSDTPEYTSVHYSSDQPLVAFQLNLAATLTTLDAFAAGIRSRGADVPDGSAGYDNGTVAAPGTTIISQGQSYQNTAALAPESLVAIIKNGKAYLYHPALGNAVLSDQNSRRAVGYFLAGLSGGASAPSSAGKILREAVFPGGADRISMKTGVDLTYEGQETALLIRAVNTTRRWTAAKGDYTGEVARYLPLRASTIPSELFDFLDKFLEYMELGTTKLYGNETGAVVRANPSGVVKTYGSFSRAIPFYKSRGLPAELRGVSLADAQVLGTVTVLDFFYFAMEGVRTIAGLGSLTECADIAFQSGLPRFLQAKYVEWLTGDQGAAEQLYDAALKSTIHSIVGCAAAAGTAGTGEAVNTFLDVVTGLNWIIEDFMFTTFHSVLSYSHYESVQVGTTTLAITGASATPSAALETGKNGLVTLRCTTRGISIVRANATSIGGPAVIEFVLTGKDPVTQDDIWAPTSAVSVWPTTPGDQQVEFFGTGSAGSVTVNATVRVNLAITAAAASGDLYINRRGIVVISCSSFGATSVIADLSAIGGPAALELYGNAREGAYSRTDEVTPLQSGLKTIRFTASGNSATAQATATILVKTGELEFSGEMQVERTHTLPSSYGCVPTGSCNGVLPITLTLHDNGTVTARTSSPLLPVPKANCIPPPAWLTCEVKQTELVDLTGTHDGKGNFTFYFWRLQPEEPQIGEFKVTGTYTSDEARGSGENSYSGDGSWHVKVSFVLKP